MRHFRLAVVLGAIALLPAAAMADLSLQETFTLPSPLSGYDQETGSSFSGFNPALGTLDSITLNLSAAATWSGGGAGDFNQVLYQLTLSGNGQEDEIFPVTRAGNGTSSGSFGNLTLSDPGLLDLFIGYPTITPSVLARNEGAAAASISSAFSDGSVTYNYTPGVSPVPEPSAIVLLLTLLGVVALALRKRVWGRSAASQPAR